MCPSVLQSSKLSRANISRKFTTNNATTLSVCTSFQCSSKISISHYYANKSVTQSEEEKKVQFNDDHSNKSKFNKTTVQNRTGKPTGKECMLH